MKQLITHLSLLLSINLLLTQPSPAGIELDRIVAVINDDVVMLSELSEKVRTIKNQLREQGTPLPPSSILEKQVLDRLILTKLQIQMARNTGIRVDEETLNRTISNIASENELSLSQFREILESDGYSYEDFREDIRNEILISRLQQRQVDNRVTVSEREIENFLSNQEHQGEADIEFRISHILIATPEGASSKQITETKQTAEKVLNDLKSGIDFNSLAARRSTGA